MKKEKKGSKDIMYIYLYIYRPICNYTQIIYNRGYIYYIYTRKKKEVQRFFFFCVFDPLAL